MPGPLNFYRDGEDSWPTVWRLADLDEDTATLSDKFAWLADDLILRTAVNILDNGLRAPGVGPGVLAGLVAAHVRFCLGVNPDVDLEEAADLFRRAWLETAEATKASLAAVADEA